MANIFSRKKYEDNFKSSNVNPFANNTIYGVKRPIQQGQSKQTQVKPELKYTNKTRPESINQTRTDMSTRYNPTEAAKPIIETPQDNRTGFEKTAQKRVENIRSRYEEQAPNINASYDTTNKALRESASSYNDLVKQAQDRAKQEQSLIEQQYGAEAEQKEMTEAEKDLYRLAQSKRVTDAQRMNKFANLNTVGSTGYYGMSGEQQRGDTEFLRGQQEVLGGAQERISGIRNLKRQKTLEAQTQVQNLIGEYKLKVAEINKSLADNEIARRDALQKAYYDMEDRVLGIEDQLNKDLVDVEKAAAKSSDVTKLRGEYLKRLDEAKFVQVRDAFTRVNNATEDAAGDLSLIFSYMKMLDPGSTVREGEFANAQNTAGVPEQIRNLYNRAATGQRLSPNQRTSFKNQAKVIYDQTLTDKQALDTYYNQLAGDRAFEVTGAYGTFTSTPSSTTGRSYQVGSYLVEEL